MPASTVWAQVALTDADTVYNLYTLLTAIDSTMPIRCCELILSAVETNNPVSIGSSSMSTDGAIYGMRIQGQTTPLAGIERAVHFTHEGNTIHLKSFYLMGVTTAAMHVNVCVTVR